MPKTLPRNGALADQLDLLADLSEILEEESFKVIAYRRAAGRIRESPLPIAELALDGKAKELPGIGKTIEAKVVEVVEDGEMHALTKRRGLVPAGVVEFLRLPGVGPKTAARIWTQLGITSLDGLKAAAEAGRLRDLSGMGAKSEEKILRALEATRSRSAASSPWRCRLCVVSSLSCRRIRQRSPSRRPEASDAVARPCGTSTSSRLRATRQR
jgi:DNA polymerase/3'-5' exonuclease PolX